MGQNTQYKQSKGWVIELVLSQFACHIPFSGDQFSLYALNLVRIVGINCALNHHVSFFNVFIMDITDLFY